ncbi:MAG: CBS domain-containing protein [Candidatus Thiodiazotropha sp. (ex Troendleina suluensis)]|nr:CBS domain-containing protein [Candidatus Thiodiazotropha sp. (ex Troendleina suluensis)]
MSALLLNDILTAEVETVADDTPIRQVLAIMEHSQISCIVATDRHNRPLGIFTEQDAIQLMADEHPIKDLCMGEVMSSPPLTAGEEVDFLDAYRMMTEKTYRHLLVIDKAAWSV